MSANAAPRQIGRILAAGVMRLNAAQSSNRYLHDGETVS